MYVVMVRLISEGLTRRSLAIEFRAGKYMFADRGENMDAMAAASMISRFCVFVKTECRSLSEGGSKGVDSVGGLAWLQLG
jgi:hypothetical protein